MNRLVELKQRIDEYKQHSLKAETTARDKLRRYPQATTPLSPAEVLRREVLRHHTRTLLLNEILDWIGELEGMKLHCLHSLPNTDHPEFLVYHVQQYMTEKEAAEVNATFEANGERLRWKPVEE